MIIIKRMGLLQLYLRGGRQNVSLSNNIPKGNITLKNVAVHFNVENHGFYLMTLNLPFLYTNHTQSNISKRGLLISLDHTKSTSIQSMDQALGQVEIPRNFEVDIDLDNGHQIVLETDTRAGAAFDFNKHASGMSWWGADYYQGVANAGAYISIGLDADKVYDYSSTAAASTPVEVGSVNVIETSSGVIDGPKPFLYSVLLTFEYEDGLIEERLQHLIS